MRAVIRLNQQVLQRWKWARELVQIEVIVPDLKSLCMFLISSTKTETAEMERSHNTKTKQIRRLCLKMKPMQEHQMACRGRLQMLPKEV
uniref:Uncharacterized protein n=1 Tax=Labrus bergylta TaxID=56723 RepID=A0A3Q3EMP6_9LABR